MATQKLNTLDAIAAAMTDGRRDPESLATALFAVDTAQKREGMRATVRTWNMLGTLALAAARKTDAEIDGTTYGPIGKALGVTDSKSGATWAGWGYSSLFKACDAARLAVTVGKSGIVLPDYADYVDAMPGKADNAREYVTWAVKRLPGASTRGASNREEGARKRQEEAGGVKVAAVRVKTSDVQDAAVRIASGDRTRVIAMGVTYDMVAHEGRESLVALINACTAQVNRIDQGITVLAENAPTPDLADVSIEALAAALKVAQARAAAA